MTASLVMLWHMHQPEYTDPVSGEYALPWTRLHAVKDYDEFADVLAEHPTVKTTVNFTPVLCEQLRAIGGGGSDVYAALSEKPASYLTQVEREFILSNFFKANFETMVRPYERYAELFFERGRDASEEKIHEAAKTFSAQKIRDLQVWANLAWCSETLRRKDPVVRELTAKGRDFTDEEKLALIGVHRRVCAGVLEKYRRLREAGIIEISTTPYYHPILPLLLDMKDAQIASPGLKLPRRTRPFTRDARWHVEEAIKFCETVFGQKPTGMWPAEGSVSEKACDLLADCGVRWAATDEHILAKSLEGGAAADTPARPFVLKTPHGPIHLFFRNHALSDRIGFTYAQFPPEKAARDFLARVESTAEREGDGAVVTVILDGENAWESYRGASCRPFLTELFGAIERSNVTPRTASECLEASQALPLERLEPGSWINGNFNIWIGHQEDNAAWDVLQSVREFVERMPSGAARDRALRLLKVAEGSDWYWWFGDDHSSMDDLMFDRLFRENLITVCKLAGAPAPKELMEPIKKIKGVVESKPPTEIFTPTLDGLIHPFYEWMGAGRVDISFPAGAMHKAAYHLQRLYWGFDETSVYFCLETAGLPEGAQIRLSFKMPGETMEARLPTQSHMPVAKLHRRDGECSISCAHDEVLEVGIPLSALNLSPSMSFFVTVSILVEEMEIERWPIGKNLEILVPEPSFFAMQWMV